MLTTCAATIQGPLFSAFQGSCPASVLVMNCKSERVRNKNMECIVKNHESLYGELDNKPNMWLSLCTTQDSGSGLVQLWLNGKPVRKFLLSGGAIQAPSTTILGPEQDTRGGFDPQRQLDYQITGRVLIENKAIVCQ
uniref:Pentraxin (PTX) domain-containing protein n=1 Tax=Nothobranchius furzeri TaxID=105023 RepID=A0A8C6NZ42_NOTFU